MIQEKVNKIEMVVLNDDDFLSPYCGHDPVISGEVADYIENAVKAGGPAPKICLHIFSNVITEQEARLYDRAIRNYYQNEREHLRRERRWNAFFSLIMLLAGVLIFSARIVFSAIFEQEILSELVDIAGWVFVWEAVDQYAFERHKINLEYGMACRMVNAEISFAPLKEEESETEEECAKSV